VRRDLVLDCHCGGDGGLSVQRCPHTALVTGGRHQLASTNLSKSAMRAPTASARTPNASSGCPPRLSQNVRYPNHLAPAASHPAAAQKTISSGRARKAWVPIS